MPYIIINNISRFLVKRFKYKIQPTVIVLFFCILGFLTGVFTLALWHENFLVAENVLGQDFLYSISDVEIDKRALFFLSLERRLRAFFLLFLLTFSSVNFFCNIVFFFLNGLYVGSIIELFTIRYGLQGILIYLSFVLPQGVFYVMGFLTLGCWCLRLEMKQGKNMNKKVGKIKTEFNKKELVIAFLLVFIGILMESFVNPKIFFVFN